MAKNLQKLYEYYNNRINNFFTFLIGDKGLGKTFTIKEFLKGKNNVLYIKNTNSPYSLDCINDAIINYTYKQLPLTSNSLSTPDILRKLMVEIYEKNNSIIVFEGINSYGSELQDFCLSFFRYVLNFDNSKNFIIIEVDSDYNKNDTFLDEIYSMTLKTEFIKFKNKSEEELKDILFSSFNYNLKINNYELNYILKSSLGNIMRLFVIINLLKQEEYIVRVEKKWICFEIPRNILTDNLLDYVLKRYERLDENLKIVLQKSSILGASFNSEQLSKSFNLLNAEQELTRIEKISSLIIRVENRTNVNYNFSPEEICETIQNLAADNERKLWNRMVAEYYVIKSKAKNISVSELFCVFFKISICYKNSNDIEKSIVYHFKAIRLSVDLYDYKQALNIIASLKEITYLHDEYGFEYYEAERWEAHCRKELGDYLSASNLYYNLLRYRLLSSNEELEIEYLYGSMLYYIGKVDESKNILLNLKSNIEKKEYHDILFEVLSLLSSVYGFLREYDIANDYFSRSLNLSKLEKLEKRYYTQIRKSSMFWDLEITLPLMQSAMYYFESENNISEVAKIEHNIGTDLLYLGDYSQAISHLEKAQKTFLSYASNDVHYTYNCLGIFNFIYMNDPTAAIECFEKALSYEPVLFSKMVLYINLSACYRCLSNFEKSIELINKAKDIQCSLGINVPSYLIYLYINEALYLKACNDISGSIKAFLKCFDLKLNNNQKGLVGKNLSILMDNPPEDILIYSKINMDELYNKFYEKNVCLSTLRFWE